MNALSALLLRKFDITAFFVTHDQDEAMAIADRVAVMSDGRVVQSGTPEKLYRNRKSPIVAGFFGSAMHLDGLRNGTQLELAGGTLALSRDGNRHKEFVRAEDVRIDLEGHLWGKSRR